MKLTVTQLRRIIKEETQRVLLEYEQVIVRRGEDLYIRDDEGNEDYYSPVEGSDYEHLRDGEASEAQVGTVAGWGAPRRGGRDKYGWGTGGSRYGRGGRW
jgi:hypothetical protein